MLIFVLLHKFASRFSSSSSLFSAQEVFDANTENITLRIMPANGDKLATVEEIRAEIAKMAKAIETRNVNIINLWVGTIEECLECLYPLVRAV